MTRHLPRRSLLVATVLATPLAASCTTQPEPEPSPTPEAITTPAPSDGEEWELVTPTPDRQEGDEAEADSLMNPEATDQDKKDAAAAALATAEIWIQGSTLDQNQWNQALMDTMTELAQSAYDGGWWGYRFTASDITEVPEILTATASSATTRIHTNDGTLTITVVRETPNSPWLTSGLEPEGQV